jgi:hypothetical protein
MTKHLRKMRSWPDHKAWFKFIDIDTCLDSIYASDNAYIVDDAFLVVYELVTPWYAKEDVVLLNEVIILRLVPGGDFKNVASFLERKREEAGAKLVCVGTALTRTDAALASVYHKLGFKTETIILVQDPALT